MRGPYKIVLEKNLSSADCKQRPQFVGLKGGGGGGVSHLVIFSQYFLSKPVMISLG